MNARNIVKKNNFQKIKEKIIVIKIKKSIKLLTLEIYQEFLFSSAA